MFSPLRVATGAVMLLSLVASRADAAGSGPARWTEWHASGDDVHVTLEPSGIAHIEHAVRYRIVMGPLKEIHMNGIERAAVVAPEGSVTGEDGRDVVTHVASKGDGTLDILVDDPKGLKRGNCTFHVRYDVDLVGAKELVRDGAMWRFSWRPPIAPEGYDAARVLLTVPPAQTEPRAVKTGPLPNGMPAGEGDEGGEDGVISTLHRTADKDELELVRPHVARGESPIWAVRLDPKAFPLVRAPELRPPPPSPPAEPNRIREAIWALGLFAVALLFGSLVRSKRARFAAACARATVKPAPLVPMPSGVAAAMAGVLASGGVALQALASPITGAALLATAMLFGVSRTPIAKRSPRGPGRWLALRPDEALATEATRDVLDIGTRSGKIAVAVTSLAAALVAVASRALAPEAPYLVAIDALALVPLFVTGVRAQLPPDPVRAPARILAPVFDALKKNGALKVAPWARVPIGADAADELRLLVLPRASLPGLVGIELGVSWTRTATAYAPRPEVLVRVHDGTDAAARLAAIAPFARPVTGRKPEEKVARLLPRLPGRAAALALVQRLARELVDRRVKIGGWDGPERRVDRDPTDKVPAAA